MELYKEILIHALGNEPMNISFPNLQITSAEIVNSQSYALLCKIKKVICDDTLDDRECFMKIEQIVCLLEQNNIDTGNRHDFG